ncbi:DUF6773 family protein [Clostridium sp.]|uniref:DUF6773 family protein n=1 Tax=Clostridium sp. TaxID=1506 RepID=UPI003D6D2FC9
MYKNDKLDEMQVQKRNKIGNNCFMAMFYLLFIDLGLYNIGIEWIAYPMNVLIIINICMGYYLIRTVWAGAYLGVNSRNINSKYIIGGVILSVFFLIIGATITLSFKGKVPFFSNFGPVIIIISIFILVLLSIIAFGNISRHKSDSGEE